MASTFRVTGCSSYVVLVTASVLGCSSGSVGGNTGASDGGTVTHPASDGGAKDAHRVSDARPHTDGGDAAAAKDGGRVDARATDGGGEAGGPLTSPRHLIGLAPGDWIESLAFTEDGTSLWAASEAQVGGATGETLGWTVSSGAPVPGLTGPTWSVSTDPTGQNLAVGGPAVTVVTPGPSAVAPVMTLAGAAGSVAYSHDGKWIAAAAPATGQVIIFSATDGSVVASVAHPVVTDERIWRVTFSPDDSMLATGSGQNGFGSPHGSTFVWKTADWSQLTEVTCTTFDATFSSDGSMLALACWLNVKLVATSDWTVTSTLVLPASAEALGVVFSPDGSKLAVGAFEGGVQVYTAADASLLAHLTDGQKSPTIKGIAWSPDGATLAGGGWGDSVVRLWAAPP